MAGPFRTVVIPLEPACRHPLSKRQGAAKTYCSACGAFTKPYVPKRKRAAAGGTARKR